MPIAELQSAGIFEPIDVELARALGRAVKGATEETELAVALTSRSVRRGHACFPLSTTLEQVLAAHDSMDAIREHWPSADRWQKQLEASALTHDGPMVLDDKGRLYLRRYWQFEQDIAHELRDRASAKPLNPTTAGLEERQRIVTRIFPRAADELRRNAAERAFAHPVSLVCGGPGTGKTTTVASILAFLIEAGWSPPNDPPRTLLLAPTGKAAARLGEAVDNAKQAIDAPAWVLGAIPTQATTVHQALGKRRIGTGFARDREHPIRAGLVVLDEGSMTDLALMRQLLVALPDGARLIIMGDPDQLTSVEAGSVLRDLVAASQQTWWRESATFLTETFRHEAEGGIAGALEAIRAQDASAFEASWAEQGEGAVVWRPAASLPDELARAAHQWAAVVQETDDARHFEARNKYIVLCALRQGPQGARRVGDAIENRVRAQLGDPANLLRPIIIEENDHTLGVYNGDLGAIRHDEAGGADLATLSRSAGELQQVAATRLPRYSSAFALTIHKAQGSEFDEVLVVFPSEDTPWLTRELLYTAVSRAKTHVRLVGPKSAFRATLSRRADRHSGLVDAIAAAKPPR